VTSVQCVIPNVRYCHVFQHYRSWILPPPHWCHSSSLPA
jgi:hypothetical protein